MRQSITIAFLATAAVFGLEPARSAAQPPPRPVGPVVNPPKFSTYLNLVPANGNAAVNYYGIIRPQLQIANQVLALQQNQANPIAQFGAAGADQPITTGTPFGFQNYRLYFQNQFTAGGVAGGVGPNFGPWKK